MSILDDWRDEEIRRMLSVLLDEFCMSFAEQELGGDSTSRASNALKRFETGLLVLDRVIEVTKPLLEEKR